MVKRRIPVSKCSFYVLAILVLTVAITVGFMLFAGQKANAESSQYVPGKAIICVKESKQSILDNPMQPLSFFQNLDANDGIVNKESEALNYTVEEELMSLDNVKELKDTAKTDNKIMDLPNSFCLFQKLDNTSNTESCKLLRVNCDNTEDFVKKANCSKEILWAQPDYIMTKSSLENSLPKYSDPGYVDQWAYNKATDYTSYDINAEKYWEEDAAQNKVKESVVAVIDTGVDYTHEDLVNNICKDLDKPELKNLGGGDYGYNAVRNADGSLDSTDPMDKGAHGTHCASAIAAEFNNKGIRGANGAHAKIIPCRFLGPKGGPTSDALKCYNYIITAKKAGIDVSVISNSWGDSNSHLVPNYALDSVITKAGKAGIISVFAAGNDGRNLDNYTASSERNKYAIIVGASNDIAQPAYFSNYGVRSVDVFAPGVSILSGCTTYVPKPEDGESDERNFVSSASPKENIYGALNFGNDNNDGKVLIPVEGLVAEQINNELAIHNTIDGKTNNGTLSFDLSSFTPGEVPVVVRMTINKSDLPEGMLDSETLPFMSGSFKIDNMNLSPDYIVYRYFDSEKGTYKLLGSRTFTQRFLSDENPIAVKCEDSTPWTNNNKDDKITLAVTFYISDCTEGATLTLSDITFGKNPVDYCYMSGTSMACPIAAAVTSVVTGLLDHSNGEQAQYCADIVKGSVNYSDNLKDISRNPGVVDIYKAYKAAAFGDTSQLRPVVDEINYVYNEDGSMDLNVKGNFLDNANTFAIEYNGDYLTLDNSQIAKSNTEIKANIKEKIEACTLAFYAKVDENNYGRNYIDLPGTSKYYKELNAPNNSYSYNDVSYTSKDMVPVKMTTTDNAAYSLMFQQTYDEHLSIQLEKYTYADGSWTSIDLGPLNIKSDFYDGENEYNAYNLSLASGKDEIYFLYTKDFQEINNYHLATYSEITNEWVNDIDLSEIAQNGDMLCNYHGELLLAGKNLYLTDEERHRTTDILVISPRDASQIKEFGNFPNLEKKETADTIFKDDTPTTQDIICGDMSVYGDCIYINNRLFDQVSQEVGTPLVYNGSEWSEVGQDFYSSLTPQTSALGAAAISGGFIEIGMVLKGKEAVSSEDSGLLKSSEDEISYNTDSWVYLKDSDKFVQIEDRFFPSKLICSTGVCHNNTFYCLGLSSLDKKLIFKSLDLSLFSLNSQNVESNANLFKLEIADRIPVASSLPDNTDEIDEPVADDNATATNTPALLNTNNADASFNSVLESTAAERNVDTTVSATGDETYAYIICLLSLMILAFVVLRKSYKSER